MNTLLRLTSITALIAATLAAQGGNQQKTNPAPRPWPQQWPTAVTGTGSGTQRPATRTTTPATVPTPALAPKPDVLFYEELAKAQRLREEWKELQKQLPTTIAPNAPRDQMRLVREKVKLAALRKQAEVAAYKIYYDQLKAHWEKRIGEVKISEEQRKKDLEAAKAMLEAEKAELADIEARLTQLDASAEEARKTLIIIRDAKAKNIQILERAVAEGEASVTVLDGNKSYALRMVLLLESNLDSNLTGQRYWSLVYNGLGDLIGYYIDRSEREPFVHPQGESE